MNAAGGIYTRLPGRAWSLFGAATLWLAADHVLQVRLRGYTEVYRRFYFGDLQLLALQPTGGYFRWALGLGLPALLAGIAALSDLAPAWELWAVVGALFAVPLVVHLARGETCRCFVTTSLGTTELVALSRIRAARKSLARIREGVEAVQGPLVAQPPIDAEADAAAAADAARSAQHPAPPPPLPMAGPPALPSRRSTRWHWVLVTLLAVDAVVSAGQASTDIFALDFLGTVLAVAEVAVAVAAIVAQGRSGLARPALRRFPWAALAYIGCLMIVGLVAGTVWSVRQANAGGVPSASFSVPPSFEVVAIFGYLGVALWGWLALLPRRSREGNE